MSQKRYKSVEEVDVLVNRGRTLSSKVATYNQRVCSEGDSLAQEIVELSKEIEVALKNSPSDNVTEEIKRAKAIVQGHGPGGDLRKLCKQKTPFLLSLLVGTSTNVVTLQRNEAIRLKEAYYGFLDKTSIMLFCFSSSLLLADHLRKDVPKEFSLTPPYMACVQVYLCWLLYFYTALALRENVLKVNGSSIRAWWIRHHYFSVATCLLVLTLPVNSPAVQIFVRKWISWSCLQSIVMVISNNYQRRRLYIRIALGKNRAMDVVSGETSGGSGLMLLLYPLLFGLQIFQTVIGLQMLLSTVGAFISTEGWLEVERQESDLRGSRGVAVAGFLMLFMGICNFKTTVSTILSKSHSKRTANKQPLRPAGILEKVTDDSGRSDAALTSPASTKSGSKNDSDGASGSKPIEDSGKSLSKNMQENSADQSQIPDSKLPENSISYESEAAKGQEDKDGEGPKNGEKQKSKSQGGSPTEKPPLPAGFKARS